MTRARTRTDTRALALPPASQPPFVLRSTHAYAHARIPASSHMRAHGHTHTHACAHTRPAARPCPTPRARRGGAGSRRGRAPRSRSARDRRRRASVLCRRGGPGAEAPQTEPPRFLSARTAGLCAAGRRDGAPGPGGPRPTHDPRPQPSRASPGRRLLSQQLRLGGGMGGEAGALSRGRFGNSLSLGSVAETWTREP